MPTHRGICISVQTQYDAASIPEYPPLYVPLTPSPRKEHPSSNIISYNLIPSFDPNSTSKDSASKPPRAAEVYIPLYQGAQFWIHYQCPEPPPQFDDYNQLKPIETRFYYFKLYLRGKCVLSWGVGRDNGWAGKVSFGIYDSGTDFDGRRILEKRAFFFEKEEGTPDPDDGFEIRVFRCKTRRREETKYEKWEKGIDGGCGFRLNGAGRMKRSEPRRMYTYALVDAVDSPYAVFRYHCRSASKSPPSFDAESTRLTWPEGQLEDVGFDLSGGYGIRATPAPSPQLSPRGPTELSPSAPAVPRDAIRSNRLSYPPGIRLSPTKSRSREQSPVKKNQRPRDTVDLSHEFHQITLADEISSKSVIRRPIWGLSKPLPDVPDKRESAVGVHALSRSTSNVAETLKGIVQNRLKRRTDSRDERSTSK